MMPITMHIAINGTGGANRATYLLFAVTGVYKEMAGPPLPLQESLKKLLMEVDSPGTS